MRFPWRPGHRHSWPQSHRGERPLSSLPGCLLWKKDQRSTQHVPRRMGQNKQGTVDTWKQHSLNMFRPQIRDLQGTQEWNKREGPGVWISTKGALSLPLQVLCRCNRKAFYGGQPEACKVRVSARRLWCLGLERSPAVNGQIVLASYRASPAA